MLISNFSFSSDVLHFAIHTELPRSALDYYPTRLNRKDGRLPPVIATTFADFCWVVSEGTTRENVEQVKTPVPSMIKFEQNEIMRPVVLGDLSWALPSKFADDLIECMHALNTTVLEGILEDAVMYGPF